MKIELVINFYGFGPVAILSANREHETDESFDVYRAVRRRSGEFAVLNPTALPRPTICRYNVDISNNRLEL